MINKLTDIEIAQRIAASLANLPMGIRGEVSIVFPGDAPSYVHVDIEAWEQADAEANANTDGIDQTFWADSWSIEESMNADTVVDMLEDIDAKVLAYRNYHQHVMELVHKQYEQKYGEYAEWIVLDKSKMQIVAQRRDFYDYLREEFCEDENIVILRTPDDTPF